MSDVTVNQTVTSIVSTVLAITKCWLTHQRLVDLDGLIELDLLKEPIKINSVGHENVPYDGTPAFNNHFDPGFVIFKLEKRCSPARNVCVRLSFVFNCVFCFALASGLPEHQAPTHQFLCPINRMRAYLPYANQHSDCTKHLRR